MSVIDLASIRRRDDRARELALWRVVAATYVDLCGDDPKALRRLAVSITDLADLE